MAKDDAVKDDGLMDKACKSYGIDKKHILSSRVYPDQSIVIVTVGGAKVTYRDGMEVTPLSPERVDGISRKPAKKPIAGKSKK